MIEALGRPLASSRFAQHIILLFQIGSNNLTFQARPIKKHLSSSQEPVNLLTLAKTGCGGLTKPLHG